jgi:hypothetical protein
MNENKPLCETGGAEMRKGYNAVPHQVDMQPDRQPTGSGSESQQGGAQGGANGGTTTAPQGGDKKE